ncbi:MAG: hypothetical protein N838_07735 [Thiohalocapsa sp. PB-PSB1]|jgi:hypothetical protein|nr:MAG: hypothetical protein N838_11560 [Thiohalocapsa sp. PB-PSB1]QQO53273.1 MAG: hypothetical protein N838_07735 [Thiohalocapsa sp. PB-PSB1]
MSVQRTLGFQPSGDLRSVIQLGIDLRQSQAGASPRAHDVLLCNMISRE